MARTHSNAHGEVKSDRNPFRRSSRQHDRGLLKDVPGLGGVLDSVLDRGAAILLGCTRDGGSVSITILDGEDRHKAYCAHQVDLDSAVQAIGEMYQNMTP